MVLIPCCGAVAERQRAEIKLPPGAGAEITKYGSGSGSFLFTTDLKKELYREKIKINEEVFENWYNTVLLLSP
jgi:hypothetical protein